MASSDASVLTRPSEVTTRPVAVAAHYVFQLDLVLLAVVAGLVGYGLWVIGSVTADDIPGDTSFFLTRQSLAAGLGFVALVGLASTNPDLLRRARGPLYVITLVLLVLVLFTEPIRESRRWIDVDFFNFQPSEFAKLAVAVVVASILAASVEDGIGWRRTGLALVVTAPPVLLIFVEPDFGTSLIVALVVAAGLFFAGAKWPIIAALAVFAATVAVAVLWLLPANGVTILKPYQEDRLLGFLDPGSDPTGSTYNINQSITAVGAGGLTGRGTDGASPDQRVLSAGARHRLRLLLAGRATRLSRGRTPLAPLWTPCVARSAHRRTCAESLSDGARRLDRLDLPLPDRRECRHDHGDRARGWYSSAVC